MWAPANNASARTARTSAGDNFPRRSFFQVRLKLDAEQRQLRFRGPEDLHSFAAIAVPVNDVNRALGDAPEPRASSSARRLRPSYAPRPRAWATDIRRTR